MGQASYDDLKGRLREVATLGSVGSLLSWDQETMMPRDAASFRAEEVALIARLAHERRTDARIGELLDLCEKDPDLGSDPLEAANLREIRRDYDRACRLPAELVEEIAQTCSRALEVWKQARADSDFESFRPWLARVFELERQKGECFGGAGDGELYDRLLEEYEPGMTASQLDGIFAPLRGDLAPLIAEFADDGPMGLESLRVPLATQSRLNRDLAGRLGYDLGAGRLDESTHPFTEGLGPGDTRITTRYREEGFFEALGSTIHEVGHALYEQGLPKEHRHGQPLAQAAGLGIHESQSRMWENHVGRSRAFWSWLLPRAREATGASLQGVGLGQVMRAVNRVRPQSVRVESDETTYNMHIMLRFDLERAVMRGDLAVEDVPGFWNDRMKRDLNVDVVDDANGCLQDIHWSLGAIGYFPTYTLGSLYAAQFWETIVEVIPQLGGQIASGNFSTLLGWLRENVHRHGRRFTAAELCERATGSALSHEPLIRHLRARQQDLREAR